MVWKIIKDCSDQQNPIYGKITDAINMDMICRVTWDANRKIKIAHLANGDQVDLVDGTTTDFDGLIGLMPK